MRSREQADDVDRVIDSIPVRMIAPGVSGQDLETNNQGGTMGLTKKRAAPRCSKCGEPGHRATTCGKNEGGRSAVRTVRASAGDEIVVRVRLVVSVEAGT